MLFYQYITQLIEKSGKNESERETQEENRRVFEYIREQRSSGTEKGGGGGETDGGSCLKELVYSFCQ